MKISIMLSSATLVASLFFIVFVMGGVVAVNVNCTAQGKVLQCSFYELGIPVLSGLSFVGGFVLTDSIILYVTMNGWMHMKSMRARLGQIDRLKYIAEKEYYQKKIDERSFNNLIQSYDKELVELEAKLSKLK